PGSATALARRLWDAALATASFARHRPDHLAEDAAADLPQLSGSAAHLAGFDRGSRLGAVAAAALAERDRLDAALALMMVEHILGLDLDARGDVGTGGGASPEAATERIAAEERIEDVLEAGEAGARLEAACTKPLMAEAIVGPASPGVREHLVGLGGLLELLLGLGIVGVHVGMQLAGEPAKGLLDLGL